MTKKTVSDTWIIGEGTDTGAEYMIHTAVPRFICKIGISDEPEEILGFSYGLETGENLFDFVWIDDTPGKDELDELMTGAAAALDDDMYKP